jgi:hypothetical protein
MSLAGHTLASGPGLKVLTEAVLELCAGQAADIAFEARADVDVAECLAMAVAKTGALLKKADAAFKTSSARRNSMFSRRSHRSSADSSLVARPSPGSSTSSQP